MFRYTTKVSVTDCVDPVYSGTSETIPGLAPDLASLLAAAAAGEPLPQCGTPRYDESDEAGEARIGVDAMPLADIVAEGAATLKQTDKSAQTADAVGSPAATESATKASSDTE